MLYGLVNGNGNFKAFIVLQNAKPWSTLHINRGKSLAFVLLVMLTALICPNRAPGICTTTCNGALPLQTRAATLPRCVGSKLLRLGGWGRQEWSKAGLFMAFFLPGFSCGLQQSAVECSWQGGCQWHCCHDSLAERFICPCHPHCNCNIRE